MKRRDFINLAIAGSVAGITAPKALFAQTQCPTMAGGLYYTKSASGRWAKKVGGHLPHLNITKDNQGALLQVATSHEMKGYEHYIIKHIILDQDFKFLDEKRFDPMQDKSPISHFKLGDYKGIVNVLSVCNKHDTWLNTIEIT